MQLGAAIYLLGSSYFAILRGVGFVIFSVQYLEIRRELGGDPFKGINGSLGLTLYGDE